jgi:hypothetical protein
VTGSHDDTTCGGTRALGAGDCEAWRDGFLGQPTNAVTSVAYVAAGAWLLARARHVEPGERWRAGAYGAALAASGVGSVAYHGWGGRLSHWLHDVSLAALLAALPAEQLASVRGWGSGQALSIWGLATLPAGIHLAYDPTASAPSTSVLVTAAAAGEVHRTVKRTASLDRTSRSVGRRRVSTALLAMGLAVTSYVLGRTGAPTCQPGSRWQWHGVWHVLGAVAAAAWSDRVHVLPYRADPGR